jgi:CubicO group peptidase (beta-lactamase class C family)
MMKLRTLTIIIGLTALFGIAACSGGSAPILDNQLSLTDDMMVELEAYVLEIMERYDIPGVAIAVVQGGEVVYTQGFGVRESGGDEPVTPETLMMIGSVTKSMTTMMMGSLVDKGVMDWDTPVIDILPTFALSDPDLTPKVTVRHLVCNCSGIPMQNTELTFNFNELTAEEVIEWLAEAPLTGRFGKTYGYSNQMVAAGGFVSALAAGGTYGSLYQDYVSLMQERVLDPIGMTSSTFSFEDVQKSENFAVPHVPLATYEYTSIPLNVEEVFTPVAPAGALWSNVLDMAKYMLTELNNGMAPDGTQVVSAETLGFTWKPQIQLGGGANYGLGWVVESYKGTQMIHHQGGTAGFTTDLALLPDADLGIIFISNQLFVPLHTALFPAVRYRLLEMIFQQEHEYDQQMQGMIEAEKQNWIALEEQTTDRVDLQAVDSYLGTYTNDKLGQTTLLMSAEDTLVFDLGEFTVDLLPVVGEQNSYVFNSGNFMGLTMRITSGDDGVEIFSVTNQEGTFIFRKTD